MAYTPYYNTGGTPGWQNGSAGGTPINAAALNNMENGIRNANNGAAVTLTAGTNVTINRQVCYKFGRALVLHAAFTTSAAIASGSAILTADANLETNQDILISTASGAGNEKIRTNGTKNIVTNGSLAAGMYFIDTVLVYT